MSVDGRHVAARAARRPPPAAPVRAARPVGELGGLAIDAEIRADANGRAHVELTLRALPATPATLPRGEIADNAISLIRQLEHRIGDLPALAERLAQQRQAALAEHATARDQLDRPFKYAEQLAGARQQQQIEQAIAERHSQAPQGEPTAGENGTVDSETAESLRLLAPTQGRPIDDALHAASHPPAASRRPAVAHPPPARRRR